MNAIYIPTDPTQPMTLVPIDDYTSMVTAIGGRCQYIERVRTRLTQPHLGNLVLAVDEEGLFHDWDVNVRATRLYNPGYVPMSTAPHPGAIAGPALLLREEMAPEGGYDFASTREGDMQVVETYFEGAAL